jgi:hypothetical protein
MQTLESPIQARTLPLFSAAAVAVPPARFRVAALPHLADHQFVALLSIYRGSGGLARAEEVIESFNRRKGPDVALLARWIVEQKVISFEWQCETWLPLFQFRPADMHPLPELAQVLAELNPGYDALDLANWFAQPHGLLGDRTPVSLLACQPEAVLHAARADRFIACG